MTHWRPPTTSRTRASLFLALLVLVVVSLVVGLVLADYTLKKSEEREALLDANSSARIVAQEVELAGEHLRELGASSARDAARGVTHGLNRPATRSGDALRAVWVLDTLGHEMLDSAVWIPAESLLTGGDDIRALARRIAVSRRMELQAVARRGVRPGQGQALLGEPVVENGSFANIAIALVDEGRLLAPAGSSIVASRAALLLLAGGDTARQARSMDPETRQSSPVRVPLPSGPEWFVVSTHLPRQGVMRVGIWVLGSGTVLFLLLGLIRERKQTLRFAERSVELERLSAELLRANRAKSEFLASVSHELRTPLNAIVGFVDLLRDGGYGELSTRQQVPVDRVAVSAARLRALVDQVLDMAKITAGRVDVRPETIPLQGFLVSVVSEMEPLLAGKQLTVQVEVSVEAGKVHSDPTHLRQIVINLLGNAVKYSTKGQVTLRTRLDSQGPPPRSLTSTGQYRASGGSSAGGWLALEVADQGIGIASSDQERIFEEFEQVNEQGAGGGNSPGTGLGLPISRRLAALLGGDISVESTPGQGATFTVWLPFRDEANKA